MDFKNRPIVVLVDKDNKYIDSLIPKSLVDVGVNIKKIDMGNPEEGTHRNCSCDHDKDYEKCDDGLCQNENKKNKEKIDCYYDLDKQPTKEELEKIVEEFVSSVGEEENLGFNEYQAISHSTSEYPCCCLYHQAGGHGGVRNGNDTTWVYPALGLSNEAGEVLGKLKKVMRDKDGVINEETKKELGKELGDVLWYLSELSFTLGLDLQSVAQGNVDKLRKRKAENKIKGDGDNR